MAVDQVHFCFRRVQLSELLLFSSFQVSLSPLDQIMPLVPCRHDMYFSDSRLQSLTFLAHALLGSVPSYSSAAKPKNAAPTAPSPMPCTFNRPPAAGLEFELVAAPEADCDAVLAALLRLALTLDAVAPAAELAVDAEPDADARLPVVVALLELVPVPVPVLEAVELAVQPAETGWWTRLAERTWTFPE